MCMRAGRLVRGSSRSGAATRGCCARLAREQRDHTTRRRRAATGLTRSSGADGWLGRAHRLALRAHSVRRAPEQSQGNVRKREMRVGSEQSRDEVPAEAVLQPPQHLGLWGQDTARATTRLTRSEEHTSELQSLAYLVCRLLLEKK